MPRFSVAVSDEVFEKLGELSKVLAVQQGRWSWARPWSRDRTAAHVIGVGIRHLEHLIQKADLPVDSNASGSGRS